MKTIFDEVRQLLTRCILASIFVVFLFLIASPILGGERVALVIGNGDYGEQSQLTGPSEDAKAMAKSLEIAGFQVTLLENANLMQMDKALLQFGKSSEGAEASWLFFAGHSLQTDGKSYLVPAGAKITDPSKIRYKSVSLSQTLSKMQRGSSQLKVVVLDCSRENPMTKALGEGAASGLASLPVGEGMLIATSVSPGAVLKDSGNYPSPFIQSLAETLQVEGLDISEVFKRVSKSVVSRKGKSYTPWIQQTYEKPFVATAVGANDLYKSKLAIEAPTEMAATVIKKPNEITPPPAPMSKIEESTNSAAIPTIPQVNTKPLPIIAEAPETPAVGGNFPNRPPPSMPKILPNPAPQNTIGSVAAKPNAISIPGLPKSGYFKNSLVFKGGPFETVPSITVHNAVIKEVQRQLLPKGKDTGWMNSETQQAILRLQAERGLPLSGLIDYQTAGALKLKLPSANKPHSMATSGGHSAGPSATSQDSTNNPPKGTAVQGGPGLVYSPFSPGKLIDARGRKPGEMVTDPYTSQIFQLPSNFQTESAGDKNKTKRGRQGRTIIPGKSYNSLNSNTIEGFQGQTILPAGNVHREKVQDIKGK